MGRVRNQGALKFKAQAVPRSGVKPISARRYSWGGENRVTPTL